MAKKTKPKKTAKKVAKPVVKKGRSPSNKSKESKVRKLIRLAKQKLKRIKK